jgi:hypothetical protein
MALSAKALGLFTTAHTPSSMHDQTSGHSLSRTKERKGVRVYLEQQKTPQSMRGFKRFI